MALSGPYVTEHIARWKHELASPHYPHRHIWPECLFHHAPFENAVSILSTGLLRSRNDPENPRPRDIAAREVNQARDHAHDRVRLYFRPKTPTQFHIEGIRKPGECKFGEEAHAPILVMLVLDAHLILTQPNIRFCDRNMQKGNAVAGDDEAYFAAIPFAKVFHEGPTSDDTIFQHRCAEVLPSSPLELAQCLRAVYFRSEPERDTVLHALGPNRQRWLQRCFVSDALKVFEKKFSFVQEIGLTREGVVFTLNPRSDRQNVEVRISISDEAGRSVAQFYSASLAAAPPQGRWIYNHAFPDGIYLVRVEIDGQLAYQAPISLTDSLF